MPEPRDEAQRDLDALRLIEDPLTLCQRQIARAGTLEHVRAEAFRLRVREAIAELIEQAQEMAREVYADDLEAQDREQPALPGLAADVRAAEQTWLPLERRAAA